MREEGEERKGREGKEGGGETGWSVCEDLDGIEAFKNRSCVWDLRDADAMFRAEPSRWVTFSDEVVFEH